LDLCSSLASCTDISGKRHFGVDWAVVWQISREEVPVLEEQAMDIMRAEFPELAKSYELETVVEPDPDNEA
jgi:hypothetical protein